MVTTQQSGDQITVYTVVALSFSTVKRIQEQMSAGMVTEIFWGVGRDKEGTDDYLQKNQTFNTEKYSNLWCLKAAMTEKQQEAMEKFILLQDKASFTGLAK